MRIVSGRMDFVCPVGILRFFITAVVRRLVCLLQHKLLFRIREL